VLLRHLADTLDLDPGPGDPVLFHNRNPD
jgi:hypothetical protein